MTNLNPQEIALAAEKYLLKKINNDDERLNYYLNHWRYSKPKNMQALFRNMIEHAQNRQGMPNSIGNIDNLKPLLFGFDPKKILKNYNSWEEIFDKIKVNYLPPGRMIRTNNKNYWVIYCKSILSVAKYLSRFSNFDNYKEYVNQFINKDNPDLRIALPLILKEEIFGFQFALACDFIKENISPEFIKPDTHINDIFRGIGICDYDDTDYDIYRKVISFSQKAEKQPYWIDKLFWLIGSGEFYKTEKYPQSMKFKSSKEEFIGIINEA